MNARARCWAVALASALASWTPARTAAAESHRVAAVNPDAALANALEVALLPWDVAVVQVTVEGPGPTMPFAIDRARAIAREAGAEVVVWVSESDDQYALWIYDLASDHARARALADPPPFTPTAAASVALAIKVLLGGTAVAPPPEPATTATATTWAFGVEGGGEARFGARRVASPLEGRAALSASVWPAPLRSWGFALRVDGGSGLVPASSSLVTGGRASDTEVGLGVAARVRLFSDAVSLRPSLGAAIHFFTFAAVRTSDGRPVSKLRVEGAAEPGLALEAALLHGRLRLGLDFTGILLPFSPRFLSGSATVLDVGPAALEGTLQAAVAWP
jgi:hypothetical protein